MKYLINQFELDTTLFQLLKNNQPVAIEPKVFDLLVYLIVNRARVVSRKELFDKLWGGREFSDASLRNSVRKARKALADNSESQNVIKNVRGQGFQFVASVEEDEDAVQDLQATPTNNLTIEESESGIAKHRIDNSRHANVELKQNYSISARISRAKKLNSQSGLFLIIIAFIILLTIVWQILTGE